MEISLLSLVGAEKLAKEFCGEQVFSKIRTKFNNAIGSAKKVCKCNLKHVRVNYLHVYIHQSNLFNRDILHGKRSPIVLLN